MNVFEGLRRLRVVLSSIAAFVAGVSASVFVNDISYLHRKPSHFPFFLVASLFGLMLFRFFFWATKREGSVVSLLASALLSILVPAMVVCVEYNAEIAMVYVASMCLAIFAARAFVKSIGWAVSGLAVGTPAGDAITMAAFAEELRRAPQDEAKATRKLMKQLGFGEWV